MPEPVQNPRVSLDIVEKLGVRGKLTLGVDEIVVPVYSIGQRDPGTRWYSAHFLVSAVAAQYGTAYFYNENPAVEAELRRIVWRPTGSQGLEVARMTAPPAGSLQHGNALDLRGSSSTLPASSTSLVRSQAQAGLLAGNEFVQLWAAGSNQMVVYDFPDGGGIIPNPDIAPAEGGIYLQLQIVNVTFDATLVWTETDLFNR